MKFEVIKTTTLTTEYREIVEADSQDTIIKMLHEGLIDFTKGYDDMDHDYEIKPIVEHLFHCTSLLRDPSLWRECSCDSSRSTR